MRVLREMLGEIWFGGFNIVFALIISVLFGLSTGLTEPPLSQPLYKWFIDIWSLTVLAYLSFCILQTILVLIVASVSALIDRVVR